MSGLTASNNRAMTAHFLNAASSVSPESSMCYLHCTTNIDGSDRVSGTFTIEPEPGTTCQAQCWKNWDQTKQLEMFGFDKPKNFSPIPITIGNGRDFAQISCSQLSINFEKGHLPTLLQVPLCLFAILLSLFKATRRRIIETKHFHASVAIRSATRR